MTETAIPREYRIVLRRNSESDGDLTPSQFTMIVVATDPEGAITEAEKLVELLQGRFRVLEILDSGPSLSRRG
jgi:hypothetical protein